MLAAADPGPNGFHDMLLDDTTIPTVTLAGGTYLGPATGIDIVFTFGNVLDFEGTSAPPVTLAEFGFRSSLPDDPTGDFFGASDGTIFTGTFKLTTHTVRRPSRSRRALRCSPCDCPGPQRFTGIRGTVDRDLGPLEAAARTLAMLRHLSGGWPPEECRSLSTNAVAESR